MVTRVILNQHRSSNVYVTIPFHKRRILRFDTFLATVTNNYPFIMEVTSKNEIQRDAIRIKSISLFAYHHNHDIVRNLLAHNNTISIKDGQGLNVTAVNTLIAIKLHSYIRSFFYFFVIPREILDVDRHADRTCACTCMRGPGDVFVVSVRGTRCD